ncbi:MAG: tetratricopeptide repeat protein [Myxococcota bacterium]
MSERDADGSATGPSDRDLLAFAQGELSEQERHRIELHLDASPEDAEVIAQLARIYGSSVEDRPSEKSPSDHHARQEPEDGSRGAPLSHTYGSPSGDEVDTQATMRSGGSLESLAAPEAGSSLGRYLIIGELGRGGMGVVLRAYDPKLQREVALKCLGPGKMSAQTQARLVLEAQAMAKLSHRNVVSVYDVELIDERFVLAMEYVEGMHLGRWVSYAQRSWREVLDVFLEAGRGLVAAHEVGLLHRDFKPANVLISATGEVKVTDFGIARVEQPEAGGPISGVPTIVESGELVYRDTGPLTEVGQVVGTPAYMPPEQFEGVDLTAAADQYAFCSSLWQALTGSLPFLVRHGGVTDLIRLKAGGSPRWPGTATAVPRRLVDAITRGLAVEPSARWPSMHSLLAELSVDPLQRRRRLAAVGILAALVAGGVGWRTYQRSAVTRACAQQGQAIEQVWNASQADAVSEALAASGIAYASDTWARAQPRVDEFTQQWAEVRAAVCVQARREQTLDASTQAMARSCLDEQRAMLDGLIAQWRMPDSMVVARVGLAAWSLPAPSVCTDPRELRLRGHAPDEPETRQAVQVLREQIASASALLQMGQYAEALTEVEAVLEQVGTVERPRLLVAAQQLQGDVLVALGRYEEALQVLETAFNAAYMAGDDSGVLNAANELSFVEGERLPRLDQARRWSELARMTEQRLELPEDHPDRSVSLNNLALLHKAAGEYEQALAAFEEALAIRAARLGPEHPHVASILNNMGIAHTDHGAYEPAKEDLQRALAIRETTLGPDHPKVAFCLSNLGNVYVAQARYEEALEFHQRALEIREVALDPNHPELAVSLISVGIAHNGLGNYVDALAAHRRALFILEQRNGPDGPEIIVALNNVGNTYQSLGRYEEALAAYERSMVIARAALGPEHVNYGMSLNNLGDVYEQRGEYDEALAAYQQALEVWSTALGDDHPYVATVLLNIGVVLHAVGQHAQALASHERALALWEPTLEPDHPYLGIALFNVGRDLVELRRPDDAKPPLRRSIEILTRDDNPPPELGEARFTLARAQWDSGGDPHEAIALARRALDDLRQIAPRRTTLIARVRTWVRARVSAN